MSSDTPQTLAEMRGLSKWVAGQVAIGRRNTLRRLIFVRSGDERDHLKIVHELDLIVSRGDVHELVFTNVHALSLFSRLISGVQEPDSGDFSLHGRPVLIGAKNYLRRPLVSLKRYLKTLIAFHQPVAKPGKSFYDEVLERFNAKDSEDVSLRDFSPELLTALTLWVASSATADIFVIPEMKPIFFPYLNFENMKRGAIILCNRSPVNFPDLLKGSIFHNGKVISTYALPAERSAYVDDFTDAKDETRGVTDLLPEGELEEDEEADDSLLPEETPDFGSATVLGPTPLIRYLGVQTPGAPVANMLVTGQSGTIEIEITFPSEYPDFSHEVNLSLRNGKGDRLFSAMSSMTNFFFRKTADRMRLKCHLAKVPFTEGDYFLAIALHIDGRTIAKHMEPTPIRITKGECLPGRVIDKKWGAVFVDYSWQAAETAEAGPVASHSPFTDLNT